MASLNSIYRPGIRRRIPAKGVSSVAGATHARLTLSSFPVHSVVQFIGFFLAYCIAGKLGQATTNIRSSNLGPVWPAYGVALAAFLVCGYQVWPAIALGACLIAFFSPVTHLAALGQAAAATIAALSGAFLLRSIAKFDNSLSRLRDALALVLFGALVSSLLSASIGVSVLYATHVHAYSGLGHAWLVYWLGDSTGVLLITPLVLTIPNLLKIRGRDRITEITGLLLLLLTACFLIFGDPSLIPVRLHVLAFAVLPFVMWSAIRFGVSGTTLSVLLIATAATVATAVGSGPFAGSTPFINAVLLDAFFAVLSVTGLSLASAITEREQAEREREQSIREQGALQVRLATEQVARAGEERLRLAQQAARIGTFEWNIQTGVNTWTPELEDMYGLPRGGFGGTQTAFENLVHPDDRDKATMLARVSLQTGLPSHGEWRVVWPDGSVHWITGRWQVFTDASGEPLRVVGVNLDITERKLAEEALIELNRTLEAQSALLQSREELLKTFVKNVPAAVAMLDRNMRYLQVSDRWCTDYFPGIADLIGRSHYESFPDMPERWKEVHRRCLEGEILRAEEDQWDGQDGPHWARWEVRPWKTEEGTVGGILILAEDITRRKQMEETVSTMSRKLIESQEQERARIGRELHDDISQRLAMVALELEQLHENPSDLQTRLQDLRNRTTELSNDVQALSHELHSSKLEYLGVVSGIKSWCKEFGERQKIEIDFNSDVSSVMPWDVGICLFRVLQESLHNAAKHSGVKRLEVQLREVQNEIHLIVTDLGRGFDADAALRGQGLGLTSMQERVRLVNGTIDIESKQMGGTKIRVRVPIESTDGSQRAAG